MDGSASRIITDADLAADFNEYGAQRCRAAADAVMGAGTIQRLRDIPQEKRRAFRNMLHSPHRSADADRAKPAAERVEVAAHGAQRVEETAAVEEPAAPKVERVEEPAAEEPVAVEETAAAEEAVGYGDSPSLAAALWYAARGIAVFPCVENGKEPATPNGFKNATTDPERIREMSAPNPNFNVAAHPEPADILVIDLDVKTDKRGNKKRGVENWEALCAEHGWPTDTRMHGSPSGGRHLFYRDWPQHHGQARRGHR